MSGLNMDYILRTLVNVTETLSNATAKPRDNQGILQPVWDMRLGREEYFSSPIFPVVLSIGFYFALCTPFMILDLYGKQLSIMKYKIQSEKEITPGQVWDTLQLTFWNQVLFVLPAAMSQWVWTPSTPLPTLAPSLFEFVWHQVACLLLFDFQYGIQHILHHYNRYLYKHVHSVHHRYHNPFSFVTQYLHPWELITVGILTTTNGWFFGCHPMTTWSYMLLSIYVSVESHIGFDFPWASHRIIPFGLFGGAPKHDMHHQKPMTNFQPFFNHWDKLFDTCCPGMSAGGVKSKEFHAWEARHREMKKLR